MLKARKNTQSQNNVAQVIIALLLVSLSLGFAYVQTILKIGGYSTIANLNSSINIYFDNLVIKDGSVESLSTPLIDTDDPTKIYFSAKLESIDDFYEFEVDMVNDDKIDAKIDEVIFNNPSEKYPDYFDVTVSYTDNMLVQKNDLLASKSTDRIRVKIKYKDSASRAPELYGEGFKINMVFEMKFSRDYGEGVKRSKGTILHKLGLTNEAQNDSSIIFGTAASTANGLGLYKRLNVEENNYPIYYYRGAVENNNVIFAGFCWKIIRTTETGGTKIIYNGTPNSSKQCTTKTGTTTQLSAVSKFNDNASSLADVGFKYGTRYSFQTQVISSMTTKLTENDYVIKSNTEATPFTFNETTQSWLSTNKEHSSTGTIEFSVKEAGDYSLAYNVSSEQNYDKAMIYKNGSQIGTTYSGVVNGSLDLTLTESDVIKVQYSKDGSQSKNNDEIYFSLGKKVNKDEILYANSYDYVDGEYILSNPITIKDWETNYSSAKNLYTCINLNGSCSSIYYIIQSETTRFYYVSLINGEKLEDILGNTNESTVLKVLDTWYETNIENDSKHYEKYLEDTIWCNDRSIYSVATNLIYFNGYGERKLTQSGANPIPAVKSDIACPNKEDRFTTNTANGNGALKHPIGLITADEATLAGNGYYGYSSSASYLYTGSNYWTMTPYMLSSNVAYMYIINSSGQMALNYSVTNSIGVRPVLSLNCDANVSSGDGTANSPYVIETN